MPSRDTSEEGAAGSTDEATTGTESTAGENTTADEESTPDVNSSPAGDTTTTGESTGEPDSGDDRPETTDNILFELYARYAGEPESRADVYGYWAFVFGSLVAFIGIVIYLVGPTQPPDPNYVIRGLAIALAAFGPPVALFGILLLLPVRRRGVYIAAIGTLVALGGVAGFIYAYPTNWTVGDPDYSSMLITVYMVGMAGVVSVAALVPIATGEKSFFFEKAYEREEEYPSVTVGEALRGGLFSVYRDGDAWHWRLIEQEALAGGPAGHLSRLESKEAVQTVKDRLADAGLMELRNAAFRLYEASEGKWRWLLMRADGSVVADSGDHYGARDDAIASVNRLKEAGPDADLLTIDDAAIDVDREDDGWHWRLVDENRTPLVSGTAGHRSREEARAAATTLGGRVGDASILAIESLGVELFEADGWRWRLIDTDETELARGSLSYDSRREVEDAAYDVLAALPDAPVVDRDEPAFEVPAVGPDEWDIRLVDDERVIARGVDTPLDRPEALERAERMAEDAAEADLVVMNDTEFEYFRDAGGWRWRLVTDDRETVATAASTYESQEDAAEAIEEVRTQAGAAELIEYEDAAFQVYESDGEWRWRLIDEDGNVLTDSGAEHESKDEAMQSMFTVKENAPDAELLEIETAAFELFERDDRWNWRLVDDGGETTAQGGDWVDTRADARDGMDQLAAQAGESPARAMDGSIFQVYADDDWGWRFVRPDGTILVESALTYGTRDEAETAVEDVVRSAAADAPVHAIDDLAIQLDARGDRLRFRFLDATRSELATSSVAFDDRESADETVASLAENAPTATVFERKETTFLLTNTGDEWRWKLVGADFDTLAIGAETVENRETAEQSAERARALFPDAEPIEYDEAAFEVLESDGVWRWQLVDEDEEVIAAGAEGYGSRDAAVQAVADVQSEVMEASVLEIETATFELHEDAGVWRWRLVDEDGTVLAESLTTYDDRSEAREALETMKTFGPESMTQVAE